MTKKPCGQFRPDHNGECLNCDETWDAHEHDIVRVARHDTLLQLWRHVSLDELLTDMNILVQLLAFRAYEMRQSTGVIELLKHFKEMHEDDRADFIATVKTAARAAKLAKKH